MMRVPVQLQGYIYYPDTTAQDKVIVLESIPSK
jgi:hypothetical protein